MGLFSKNYFDVKGKRILLTGGSQGLGLALAHLLAAKGASIIIVARTVSRLESAVASISSSVPDSSPNTNRNSKSSPPRISYISADLTSAPECARIISESTATWGAAPDIVWMCHGSSAPTLLVDSPPESLADQMTGNYLSAAWTAQAAVRAWIGRPALFTNFRATARGPPPTPRTSTTGTTTTYTGLAAAHGSSSTPKHIVFTSSFLSLYPIAGYGPYSPSKAAMRNLADTLSQELLLYERTCPVRVHTVFPATIYTEAFEREQEAKTDVTKMLEEDDEGQSAEACAAAALKGLEAGREMVPTTGLGWLVMGSVLGGSIRAKGLTGWIEGLIGLLMVFVMPWVRWDMDRRMKNWARKHGDSGMKKDA